MLISFLFFCQDISEDEEMCDLPVAREQTPIQIVCDVVCTCVYIVVFFSLQNPAVVYVDVDVDVNEDEEEEEQEEEQVDNRIPTKHPY